MNDHHSTKFCQAASHSSNTFHQLSPLSTGQIMDKSINFHLSRLCQIWREFLERFTEHARILTWKWREVTEALRGTSTHNNPLEKSSRRVSIVKNPPPALPRSLLSISTSFLIYRLDFSWSVCCFKKTKMLNCCLRLNLLKQPTLYS